MPGMKRGAPAWRVAAPGLAIALAIVVPTSAKAAPVIYPDAAQILRYSQAALAPQAQRTLDWLRSSNYFGAMYVDSGSGRAFAVRGYNNVQGAIAVARGWCRAEATGACRLYATLTPTGFQGKRSSPDGLAQKLANYYRNSYLAQVTMDSHGAFAVSGISQVGASWRYPTAADADAVALDFCHSNVEKGLAKARPAVRRAAERAHLTRCHIVDRRG